MRRNSTRDVEQFAEALLRRGVLDQVAPRLEHVESCAAVSRVTASWSLPNVGRFSVGNTDLL